MKGDKILSLHRHPGGGHHDPARTGDVPEGVAPRVPFM
jgi:hypothetical protein